MRLRLYERLLLATVRGWAHVATRADDYGMAQLSRYAWTRVHNLVANNAEYF